MHVAMVTPWEEACGIADYSRALVLALQSLIPVEVIPVRLGQRSANYFRELARAGAGFDLVHIQHEYIYFGARDPWNNYWRYFTQALPVPYVVTIHTQLPKITSGWLGKRLLRAVREGGYRIIGWRNYLEAGQFKTAQGIIVHSQRHLQALLNHGLLAEQVKVVPHGVPFSNPPGQAARARARWQWEGKLVTLPGFINPSKGHLLALAAWQQAAPDATLLIVGRAFSPADEAYAQLVERKAKSLAGRVRWLGFLSEEELTDLLAASQLVLMPYSSCTASGMLARALAQGAPVLASDLEYFKEIQAQQFCLELFHSQDSLDLARKLKALLEDETRLAQLSRGAKVWAQAHAWERIAKQTIGIYQRLISGPASKK